MRSLKIKSIKHVDAHTDTYDITIKTNVEADRNFVANGIVVHNSNGIEPTFAHEYIRNILTEDSNSKKAMTVYSYEFFEYKNIDPECKPDTLPDYFVTTDSLTPQQHIDMQAAAQRWIDSSISKTINVPTDITFEAFKDIYMYAYDSGLKGCTTFRYNPEAFTGVLVKQEDLKATKYRFTLANGSIIEASGDEYVEYEGQQHMASNLADAIKNGYYKKAN